MTATADAITGPHQCWDCGGPCREYKGSVHEWRCQACVQRYLEAGAVRGEAKALKARERLLRAASHSGSARVDGRCRDGGGLAVGRAAVPASTG
jgi:hypothetical protein